MTEPARAYLQGLKGMAFVVTCAILTPMLAASGGLLLLLPLGLHRFSEPGFWADMLQMLTMIGGNLALTGVVPGVVAAIVLVARLWRGGRVYSYTVARWAAICSAASFPLTMLMIQFSACFGWTRGLCPMTDASGWLAPLMSIMTAIITIPLGVVSALLLWRAWGAIFGRSFESPVAAGPVPVLQGSEVSAR